MTASPGLALRLCHICGVTDDAPHHDLVLATVPVVVELSMHLGCAAEVMRCETCGPQIATTEGLSGGALRVAILVHHGKGH